ncbi:MAG: peptidoglycan editing factor PgeF [Proteobacteria bacterium]|nr:peptidoglycan editing factor PgeF [Pseudomonadota bacterium]
MELIKKPDYSYIKPTKDFEGVKIFFLSKHLGIHVDELNTDSLPSQKELQKISSYFPINTKEMIFLKQVHGDEVINKTNKKMSYPTADGIITPLKHVALFLKTADCVPIFLFDPINKIIGAVHAGWRGTSLKILKKAIQKMEHFYRTKPEEVFLYIGPSIGPCCYQVKEDVYTHFSFLGKEKQNFFTRRKDKSYMMDLKGINAHIAEQAGVLIEKIEISDLCTHCNPDLFYSYRRDKEETGRNLSFIMMT